MILIVYYYKKYLWVLDSLRKLRLSNIYVSFNKYFNLVRLYDRYFVVLLFYFKMGSGKMFNLKYCSIFKVYRL